MLRIGVATCDHHPGFIANDDQPLLDAFGALGVDAALARWDDASIDWTAFEAVVIRTTWDYQERVGEFLDWVDRVAGCSRLINPAPVVRANIRKTYLRELEAAGVPIVPTRWVVDGRRASDHARDLGVEVVMKPSIGAGASGLIRIATADHAALDEHAASIGAGAEVMIQPFLPTVLERGELSLVYVDGGLTHGVRKKPAEGEFRVQIEFGGRYAIVDPTPEERRVAEASLDALAIDGAPICFARVDLVELEPGRPAIGEVELIEPELFLAMVPSAASRLAERVIARCAR